MSKESIIFFSGIFIGTMFSTVMHMWRMRRIANAVIGQFGKKKH